MRNRIAIRPQVVVMGFVAAVFLSNGATAQNSPTAIPTTKSSETAPASQTILVRFFPGVTDLLDLARSNTADAYQPHLSYDVSKTEGKTNGPVEEQAGVRVQEELGPWLPPPAESEARFQPGSIYGVRMEMRAARPNNAVRSKRSPNLDYNGILVQMFRNNPLQIINPLGPAQYGDGEANTIRNIITGRPEGLKFLGMSF